MERMNKLLLFLFIIGIFVISCTDTLDKTTGYNNKPRIEYSSCSSCLECIDQFNCPENAIKLDQRTQTAYIDADLCSGCMDCMNLFTCPDDAFTINVDDIKPAQINDIIATSDTIGMLNIQFTATGDDSTSGRAFRYELVLKDSNDQVIENDFIPTLPQNAGVTENWNLGNLPENEFVKLELEAFDELEQSSFPATEEVQILGEIIDEVPPAPIDDIIISSISMNSFQINWTSPGDDGDIGTSSYYIIKIHTEDITESNWGEIDEYEQNITPQEAGNEEILIIVDLEPVTEYFIGIKAVDESENISVLSNIAQAATTEIPDEIPPSAITDLQANPTEEIIELSWTSPGDDGSQGIAYYYEIRISQGEITELNWIDAELLEDPPVPMESGSFQNYFIEDLQQGITYYFAIKAFDENNNVSPLSNVPSANLIIDNISPSAISDLQANPTDEIIELTWTAPGDDGTQGTAFSYEIRISQETISEDNWSDNELLDDPPLPLEAGTSQYYIVENLEHEITYYFAIKTSDESDNISLLSNVPSTNLIIDIIPPSDITDLTVYEGSTSNLNTMKIQWIAPGDNGTQGIADHYEIKYSTSEITEYNWESAVLFDDPPVPQVAGSLQFCYVNVLEPATIYYFAIKAFDDFNNVNQISNSPAGKLVYQIDTVGCRNCNNCIYDCDYDAILQGPGYKYIEPDLCEACGDCTCPWPQNYIHKAVVAY